jgi:hypothetical protein
MRDPIVEEIRRIRQEHAARFNFDLDAIFEDLKEKERQSKRKIVSRAPRPARTEVPASRVDRR